MNDDDLRDLLDHAAPARPALDAGARSAAVATRARAVTRRNRLALAATVVAVVAAGVSVPLLTSSDDGRTGSVPAASDGPSPVNAGVPACPADPLVTLDLQLDGLDSPVTSVRSCPVADEPYVYPVVLPTGVLTTGVDALVADLQALPAQSVASCTTFVRREERPWALQLALADGTTVTVGPTGNSCQGWVVINRVRVNVGGVLRLYRSALVTQATDTCTQASAAPWMSLTTSPDTFEGDPADFTPVSAVACDWTSGPDGPVYAQDAGPLPPEEVARTWQDVLDHSGPSADGGSYTCRDRGGLGLALLDADGRRISLIGDSCGANFRWSGGIWPGTSTSADTITAALGGPAGR